MEAITVRAPETAKRELGLLAGIRSPLLRHQPDETLVALTRRGNVAAFETLFHRYRARLVAFAEHLLGARGPDAEDVVQEAMTAAANAMVADDRPIDVRPWLYRITRNRCLNHIREATAVTRPQKIGGDCDEHLARVIDDGSSAADQAARRHEIRMLVEDLRSLPESQRTAIILHELEDLSYKQVADTMSTSVSGVKSLLVRARLALAEIAEGRELTCDDVQLALASCEQKLGGLTGAQRAHVKNCDECARLRKRLKSTSKSLAALAPLGLLAPFQELIGDAIDTAGGAAGAAAAGGAATAAAAGGGGGAAAVGGLAIGGGAIAAKGLVAAVTLGVVAAGSVYLPNRDAGSNVADPPAKVSTIQGAAAGVPAAPDLGSAKSASDGRSSESAKSTAATADAREPIPGVEVIAAVPVSTKPASPAGEQEVGTQDPPVIEGPRGRDETDGGAGAPGAPAPAPGSGADPNVVSDPVSSPVDPLPAAGDGSGEPIPQPDRTGDPNVVE